MNRNYIPILIWIAIALIICLIPGPDWIEVRLIGGGSLDDGSTTAVESAPPVERINQEPTVADLSVPISTTDHHSSIKTASKAFLSENVKPKERIAHIVPMIGIGFCFVRLLSHSRFSTLRPLSSVLPPGRRPLWAGGCSLIAVLLVSLSIEILQALLPESFHRGFAWDDIGISLLGGAMGAIAGAIIWRKNKLLEEVPSG